MNAAPETPVARDFSDLAILRGSAAAIAAAHVMLVLTSALVAAAWTPAGLDAGRLLLLMPGLLMEAFEPLNLFMSAVMLSAIAVVGLFVLAAHEDHTTYRAAFRAGVITAGIIIALPLIVVLLSAFVQGSFAALPGLMLFVVPALGTGGVAGLAGRFAAGAPRVLLNSRREIAG